VALRNHADPAFTTAYGLWAINKIVLYSAPAAFGVVFKAAYSPEFLEKAQ